MTPDFLVSCRLYVTPLAPVHVGCGEDMDPTGYVLDADALHEFSPSALAAVLDEADRDRLLGLVDRAGDERVLVGVRKLILERRDGLVACASRAVRVAPGVRELYDAQVGTVAQSDTRAINRLEIERIFSHPDTRSPILPGSSLKGAVRTALLDRENDGRGLGSNETSQRLQQRLFGYRRFDSDPMRLVHLADAMSAASRTTDGLAMDTAVMFAVNRKKRKITGRDGREVRSQAEQKGLYQTLEVVPALRWRAFRGGLTIHRTGLHHGQKLPGANLHWTVGDVARACNRFYRQGFADETQALRDRGLLDERWYRTIQRLMQDGLDELLDSNRAFLLRMGRHSGAESVTLNGVRSIRIMTPRDQPNRSEDEATTWWLAADRTDASSGLLPFGWVLVEMTEVSDAPAPRPGVVEVLDSFHGESGEREWHARVVQRRDTLRKEQEAEAARRSEAERRRNEREAAERARTAKRVAMTDEERMLDDLRLRLDSDREQGAPPQGQGGELAGLAVRILKTAEAWPDATRIQAADLVAEVFETIGFPKGQKGRERQRQISALREGTQ